MKSKWKKEKLGDHIIESKDTNGASYLNGSKVLSITNVEGFIESDRKTSKDLSKYKKIKAGYFAYNPYRINVGSIALADLDTKGIVSPAYVVFYTAEDLDPEYLHRFLKSDVGLFHIRRGGKGSVRSSLSFEKLQEIEIPLPPLPEQKCIVKKIKEIEEKLVKIQNERKAITKPLNFIAGAYLDSIILKQKWPKERLDRVAKINPSKSEINNIDINTEVTFVPMSVVDDIDGLIKNPEIKELKDVKKGYTYFAEGDVIFAKITPCMENGKSAIGNNLKNKLGFGSTEFHVVRPSAKILSEWIHLIFRNPSFRREAEENMPGTAGQKRVPKEFLEEYKIPMPSVDIQKKVLSDMKNFQFKIDELGMEQSKSKLAINALMPSILSKAFAGEL